jgi:hypothetical protein
LIFVENEVLVVVPDVHQDWDWVYRVLNVYGQGASFVFLGDYFDYKRSRTYDHRESLTILKTLMDTLASRATWLLGNHDMHYHPINKAWHGLLTGSGFTREAVGFLSEQMPWGRFQLAHADLGFLFTHAGLAMFPELEGLQTPQELAQKLNIDWHNLDVAEPPSYLFSIGPGAGGRSSQGGPLWHRNFESHLLPVNQMVGHTPHRMPLKYPLEGYPDVQHWYVDCMQTAWIEINKKTSVVTPRSLLEK